MLGYPYMGAGGIFIEVMAQFAPRGLRRAGGKTLVMLPDLLAAEGFQCGGMALRVLGKEHKAGCLHIQPVAGSGK